MVKEALNNSTMNFQNTNKTKYDFILFIIFNGLSATENGNTSMCCGNSESISVSLINRCIDTRCVDDQLVNTKASNASLHPGYRNYKTLCSLW